MSSVRILSQKIKISGALLDLAGLKLSSEELLAFLLRGAQEHGFLVNVSFAEKPIKVVLTWRPRLECHCHSVFGNSGLTALLDCCKLSPTPQCMEGY